jgi:hypothetical protein
MSEILSAEEFLATVERLAFAGRQTISRDEMDLRGHDAAQRERVRVLTEALVLYADADNWRSRVVYTAPEGGPNAGAKTLEYGPANDDGQHARCVLAAEEVK